MREYRFYLIGKNGHIAGPGDVHVLPDDGAALEAARQLVDGHDVEIWQEARLVAYVTPEPDKTAQSPL